MSQSASYSSSECEAVPTMRATAHATAPSRFALHVAGFRGRKVHFCTLAGNQGDRLIEQGAASVFAGVDCELVTDPRDADEIVINGGGSFNEHWNGALGRFSSFRKSFPDTPLTVGPQTYSFNERMRSQFLETLSLSATPVHLFCRETFSERILHEFRPALPEHVKVSLSQDLALELHESPWLKSRRCRSTQQYVMVSLRADTESPFSSVQWFAKHHRRSQWRKRKAIELACRGGKYISRQFMSRRIHHRIARQYFLAQAIPQALLIEASCTDTFEEFLAAVEAATLVITDRLHVAIYGYLLQKPVAFVCGDSFHKCRGVYDFSLSDERSTVAVFDTAGRLQTGQVTLGPT